MGLAANTYPCGCRRLGRLAGAVAGRGRGSAATAVAVVAGDASSDASAGVVGPLGGEGRRALGPACVTE